MNHHDKNHAGVCRYLAEERLQGTNAARRATQTDHGMHVIPPGGYNVIDFLQVLLFDNIRGDQGQALHAMLLAFGVRQVLGSVQFPGAFL